MCPVFELIFLWSPVVAEQSMRLSPQELLGILTNFGESDVRNFQDRLRLQKIVCLLQGLGVPLGYKFSWYFHGPYSRDLARDMFRGQGPKHQTRTLRFTDPQYETILRRAMSMVGRVDTRGLELLASLYYLSAKELPELGREQLLEELVKRKPKFTLEEASGAWQVLQSYDLVSR